MSFQECINVIRMLACSQGFYGRLLRDILQLSEKEQEQLKEEWEAQSFATAVDFIEYIEG